MDILKEGIPYDILSDSYKVKDLNGIGGCGKTTYLSTTFEHMGTPYIHLTSTNRLKRDIEIRFPNRNVLTVASGLYVTENCKFYSKETTPDIKTIIIDEVLQTHPNVFRWIMEHRGEYNIFVCTDDKQTLSPEQSRYMEKAYKEFENSENVIVYNPTVTHRPVTKETEKLYYESYRDSSNDGFGLFHKLIKNAPIINFNNIEFSENDIYITHTNQLEDDLYKRFDLSKRYDLDLIPKGTISSKKIKKLETYPILPQIRTQNAPFLGYFQQANVGTVIRYQGSEVYPNQKLYYLVNKHSKPNDREIYTLITRMKDINSLVIVECPEDSNLPLVSFNGCEIVEPKKLILPKDSVYLADEQGRATYNGKIKKPIETMTREIYQQVLTKHNETAEDGEIYTSIIYRGEVYNEQSFKKQQNAEKPKISLTSLLKKDQYLKCDHLPEIFRIIDEMKLGIEYPLQPRSQRVEEKKKGQRFGIDLFGAYPSVLKYGLIPDFSTFTPDDSQEIKIGIFNKDELYKKGTLIMSPLYDDFIKKGMKTITLIGSFKRIDKTYTGERFYKLYHKSIEDKAECKKGARWGYLEKHFLKVVRKGTKKCYLLQEKNQYELLMTAILSNMNFIILKMREEIYKICSIARGCQTVDCLYFDTTEDIEELGKRISVKIPNYEFRISKITTDGKFSENEVLYQNYENLKSKG